MFLYNYLFAQIRMQLQNLRSILGMYFVGKSAQRQDEGISNRLPEPWLNLLKM